MHYFVVNKGKSRGCWVTSDSVDLSSLILYRSDCIKAHHRRCVKQDTESKTLVQKTKTVKPSHPPNDSQTKMVSHASRDSKDWSSRLSLPAQLSVAECRSEIEKILLSYQLDVGKLIVEWKHAGMSSVPPSLMQTIRSKNHIRLRNAYASLQKYGAPPTDEKSLLLKLADAERAAAGQVEAIQMRRKPDSARKGMAASQAQHQTLVVSNYRTPAPKSRDDPRRSSQGRFSNTLPATPVSRGNPREWRDAASTFYRPPPAQLTSNGKSRSCNANLR